MERKGAPSRGQRTLRVEGASEGSAHINARGRLWAAELRPDVPRFSVTVFVLTRLMTYGLRPWRDPSPEVLPGLRGPAPPPVPRLLPPGETVYVCFPFGFHYYYYLFFGIKSSPSNILSPLELGHMSQQHRQRAFLR